MATLKTGNGSGNYFNEDAKLNVINYILRPDKIIHNYCGGVAVSSECPAESMALVAEQFGKSDGVQLRHWIISFAAWETTNPKLVNEIAQQITARIGAEYQAVYAVHENRAHLHIHLVCNSVSYIDGHRYYGTHREFWQFKNMIANVLKAHGIFELKYVR